MELVNKNGKITLFFVVKNRLRRFILKVKKNGSAVSDSNHFFQFFNEGQLRRKDFYFCFFDCIP